MTTFETLLLIAVTTIVIILAVGVYGIAQKLKEIIDKQGHFDNVVNQLYGIKEEVGQTNGRIDGFIPAFKKLLEHNESIENFWASDSSLVIKLLKELVDIEHKSDERNDNMFPFMQEIMRNYNPPCYSPDGICMNPHRDCINCPKRGHSGFWSTNTSIKAEDAPLQERFNGNKED